ncbi:outer membrane protein [Tepidamorphus sp. 3E244]|uniref:outer membrane protein n=1 Tax=Tepidamorphus sp. 3E244 TaxID=3385498 RepID=UPI0038FC4739
MKSINAKIAAGAVGAALLCGTANADDRFTGTAHDWSGHFIGIQGGGAWGDSESVGSASTGTYGIDGGFIGWTSGANWQNGAWVWGYESDTSFGDISGEVGGCAPANCYAQVNWFSTIRGRIGYATGMFLFYGTAGLAYGEVQSGVLGTGSLGESDDISAGLAIGAGVEMAFDQNWSAKIEYLHIDLGDNVSPGVPTAVTTDFDDIHLVRVGLKRKFDLWGLITNR